MSKKLSEAESRLLMEAALGTGTLENLHYGLKRHAWLRTARSLETKGLVKFSEGWMRRVAPKIWVTLDGFRVAKQAETLARGPR